MDEGHGFSLEGGWNARVGGVRTPGSRAYTLAAAGWPAPGVRRRGAAAH